MSDDTDAGDESAATPPIDPEKTRVLAEHAHQRPLTSCHWEPLGRFVFFGAEDNGVHRFDLKAEQVTSLRGHDSWVRAIGSTPDGETLLSGGYDGRLIWWPAAADEPEPIRVIDDAHQGWIRALAISPDGKLAASCGNDLLIKLWEVETGNRLASYEGHDCHVYNVAFAPGGESLVSCDLHGFVKFWDLPVARDSSESPEQPKLMEPTRTLPQIESLWKYDTTFRADIGGARCIGFSNDGSHLALGGITNVTNAFAGVGETAIALVDLSELSKSSKSSDADEAEAPSADGSDKPEGSNEDGEADPVATLLQAKDKPRGTAWGLAHHERGFWIGVAGGGGGGWLYFWRGDEEEEFFKLKLKSDGRGMSLSPDGSQLAIAHADRQLRIYALYEE